VVCLDTRVVETKSRVCGTSDEVTSGWEWPPVRRRRARHDGDLDDVVTVTPSLVCEERRAGGIDVQSRTDAEFVDGGEPLGRTEFAAGRPQAVHAEFLGEATDGVVAIECTQGEAIALGAEDVERGKR